MSTDAPHESPSPTAPENAGPAVAHDLAVESMEDFGEWLKKRSAANDTGEEWPKSATKRRDSNFTIDVIVGIVAGVLGLATLCGHIFEPYHPIRFLLLYGCGVAAGGAGFLGLYFLGYSVIAMLETRAKASVALIFFGMIFGIGGMAMEARERSLESQAEAEGAVIPNLQYARARGWIPPR